MIFSDFCDKVLDNAGPLWYPGPVEWRSAQYVVFKPRGNHTRWSGYIRVESGAITPGPFILRVLLMRTAARPGGRPREAYHAECRCGEPTL